MIPNYHLINTNIPMDWLVRILHMFIKYHMYIEWLLKWTKSISICRILLLLLLLRHRLVSHLHYPPKLLICSPWLFGLKELRFLYMLLLLHLIILYLFICFHFLIRFLFMMISYSIHIILTYLPYYLLIINCLILFII